MVDVFTVHTTRSLLGVHTASSIPDSEDSLRHPSPFVMIFDMTI